LYKSFHSSELIDVVTEDFDDGVAEGVEAASVPPTCFKY